MVQRGLARAMEKALQREKEGILGHPKSPLHRFRSQRRIRLFSLICRRPCLNLSSLKNELGWDMGTLRWHMDVLLDTSLAEERKRGGSRVVFPARLLDDHDVSALTLLQDNSNLSVLVDCMQVPGIQTSELKVKGRLSPPTVRRRIDRMGEAGFLRKIRDGSGLRLYPGPNLDAVMAGSTDHVRRQNFMAVLLSTLESDGAEPKILRSTDTELHISLKMRSGRDTMIISTEPYGWIKDQLTGSRHT